MVGPWALGGLRCPGVLAGASEGDMGGSRAPVRRVARSEGQGWPGSLPVQVLTGGPAVPVQLRVPIVGAVVNSRGWAQALTPERVEGYLGTSGEGA